MRLKSNNNAYERALDKLSYLMQMTEPRRNLIQSLYFSLPSSSSLPGFRWVGRLMVGHVNCEMPFHIQKIKEIVKCESLKFIGRNLGGYKFGIICIYMAFKSKLRVNDIIKIMRMDREGFQGVR